MSESQFPGEPPRSPLDSSRSSDVPGPASQDRLYILFILAILGGFAATWGLVILGTILGVPIIKQLGLLLYDLGSCDQRVWEGELWRPITCMFLHAGVGHLFNNMLFLIPLARVTRRWTTGHSWFTVFMVAGIAGSMLELIIHPQVSLVGASGGIAGLWGAALVVAWREIKSGLHMVMPIVVLVVFGFLLYSQVTTSILAPQAHVANFAHLGGVITGFIMGRRLPLRSASRLVDDPASR